MQVLPHLRTVLIAVFWQFAMTKRLSLRESKALLVHYHILQPYHINKVDVHQGHLGTEYILLSRKHYAFVLEATGFSGLAQGLLDIVEDEDKGKPLEVCKEI